MAGKAGKELENYVDNLPTAEKSRYMEKLALINDIDPYNIPSAEWKQDDVSLFPGWLTHIFTKPRVVAVTAGLPFVSVVHAFWGKSMSDEGGSEAGEKTEDQQVIVKADELFDANEIDQLYELLVKHKDTSNDDILWRLARAANEVGKTRKDPEKKQLVYDAYGYVEKALQINDNNSPAHKWYAILLDNKSEYEGTKVRIANSYIMKEHFLKAIELNPKDATSQHGLGVWCFLFADMAWYQRKIASAIFGTPPTSTYEEALQNFLEAEKTDPNFYSMNLVYIGKTYERMKDKQNAILYLTRARDYPIKTEDDRRAHKEAVDLLKSLGVKE